MQYSSVRQEKKLMRLKGDLKNSKEWYHEEQNAEDKRAIKDLSWRIIATKRGFGRSDSRKKR